MLPVAILAGGLATRLRPITEKIPKALVEVAGRPFISWQLDQLHNEGYYEVVICTGYLGGMIEDAIGGGHSYGLSVSYSHDGETLLGTGGALKKAAHKLGDCFFVLYGDSYLPIDFKHVERAYIECGKTGLMTILENKNKWDKSNVLFHNGALIEYNKSQPSTQMRHIDYGLSILNSKCLFDYKPDRNWDLSDLFHDLSLRGDLQGYEVYKRFYEIGTHAGLAEAAKFFHHGE
ncbi:MAG: nucleotidyl transferase [Gammaproteobacteria bacterium]|nr:nucleotidyl transferase [Gammaproteobacteria bacterium]